MTELLTAELTENEHPMTTAMTSLIRQICSLVVASATWEAWAVWVEAVLIRSLSST